MAGTSISPLGLGTTSQSVFNAVDRNGDRQVSADEFTAFLNTLLKGLTGSNPVASAGSTPTGNRASTAPPVDQPIKARARLAATPSVSTGEYQEIPGFDFRKLSDSSYVNEKYSPAVRAFSQAICAGGLRPVTSSLDAIVSYAQANGFPEAKVDGEDRIDFGDGRGGIDVITSVGTPGSHWWFQNIV